MYQDKTLTCKKCGTEFTFTAGEQAFYAGRGFRHPPQRCKSCRRKGRPAPEKPEQPAKPEQPKQPEKKRYKGVCAACGKTAWVPFQPRPEQLVYCAKCYAAMREEWEEERRPR